jgi:hypothetical protein
MKRLAVLLLSCGAAAFMLFGGLMVMGAPVQNPTSRTKLGPYGTMEADGKRFIIEGKAVSSSIHTCNLKYDDGHPGYCNGTLRVEWMVDGKVEQRDIIVTAKVAIEKDGKKPATLDSFIGGWVKVEYIQEDGLFIATSVVARTRAD